LGKVKKFLEQTMLEQRVMAPSNWPVGVQNSERIFRAGSGGIEVWLLFGIEQFDRTLGRLVDQIFDHHLSIKYSIITCRSNIRSSVVDQIFDHHLSIKYSIITSLAKSFLRSIFRTTAA
jgi:hypothetical protein